MKDNMRQILLLFLFTCATLSYASAAASPESPQDEVAEEYAASVEENLSDFITQMREMVGNIAAAIDEQIPTIEKEVNALTLKWDMYYQSWLHVIVEDDSCMQRAVDFEALKTAVNDSLTMRAALVRGKDDMKEAEDFLLAQTETYESMKSEALSLSLVKQSAPLLDKLKEQEQLSFAEIEEKYSRAKEAAKNLPDLADQMERIEEQYVTLRCASEEIQNAAYKSLWDRVKDYVYGIAAVSMILLFLNMAQARVKQVKEMRKQAKKMKEQLKKSESNDLPTI